MIFHSNSLSLSSPICIGLLIAMVILHLDVPLSFYVGAQAPANDFCINAQPIAIGSNSDPVTIDLKGYPTVDFNVTDDCLYGRSPRLPGIWFNFTGTGGRLIAGVCEKSISDTILSIYTGGCNPSARQCVAATSSGCFNTLYAPYQDIFNFETTLGTRYHALVQSFNKQPDSNFDVSIFSATPVPSNDLCVNAQPLTIGSSHIPKKFNSTFATADLEVADDCLTGGPAKNRGIWFNFTGTGRRIIAQACTYDIAYISIFTGGCNPSARQCIAATLQGCYGEKLYVETTLGTTYHMLVQMPAIRTLQESTAVSIFNAPPSPYDRCDDALPAIIGSTRFPISFDATYATSDLEVVDDCHSETTRYPGVWLNFTGTGERMEFYTGGISNACGGLKISVFTGGCNPSTLQCVAAFQPRCNRERYFFESNLGTTYHVLVQVPNQPYLATISIISAPLASNDRCVNALPVVIGSSPVPVQVNATYGSKDLDVLDDCLSGSRPKNAGIWYTFTGTGSRIVVYAPGPTYASTYISVFTGGCNPTARR